ncbi:nucleotidyltransferase [Azospirillum sp. TSO5]|uniref:nucleotidyltransferase domain-containing protein n=1 Tax=Azospirillum sp. TSO5 TaxID=716760 RepID=UPI000D61E584|nr:nucleotidyltransferase [Azospirillum sp. TSO5]PWC93023.1 hypothetical protein TSO5_16550 [Azospirillum sp. TSO5]
MYIQPSSTLKKAHIVGVLEHICQALELTESQQRLAQERYEAVGNWLASSSDPLLRGLTIYPQGSVPLGTTVKPLARQEHDVDLVGWNGALPVTTQPSALKKAIGDRLRQSGHYKDILEEKPRCWRINYANEFHLDITPSISNPSCGAGGELVPDKPLKCWKPSNPKGYRAWFEKKASMEPTYRVMKSLGSGDMRANVEPFPTQAPLKGVLRRTIQLAKRHRDVHFAKTDPSLAPISIIITTLAAKSYAYCVSSFVFDTELDLVESIIRFMPLFVDHGHLNGKPQWYVWNETTQGENFAEKWNREPKLAGAFRAWQARALSDIQEMIGLAGLDTLNKSLAASFGEAPVAKAMGSLTSAVSEVRSAGGLTIRPTVGLAAGAGTVVRTNTFFGAK